MPDPMRSYLDFEKPVAELDSKIDELRALAASGSDISEEVSRIEEKAAQALKDLYAELTPWQKTQVARHPMRPHCVDYIKELITEFTPLAGDRKFGEDEALAGRLKDAKPTVELLQGFVGLRPGPRVLDELEELVALASGKEASL